MGKRYVVPTFKVQHGHGPARVGVVAPLDNTVITILLKTAGGSVNYGGNTLLVDLFLSHYYSIKHFTFQISMISVERLYHLPIQ